MENRNRTAMGNSLAQLNSEALRSIVLAKIWFIQFPEKPRRLVWVQLRFTGQLRMVASEYQFTFIAINTQQEVYVGARYRVQSSVL